MVGFKATKPHIIIWTIICDAAYIDECRSKENVFVNVFNIMTIKIPCILRKIRMVRTLSFIAYKYLH